MTRHSLLCLSAVTHALTSQIAVAAILLLASTISANTNATTTEQYSVNQAGGVVSGTSYDACGYTDVFLLVAASGTHNLNNANNVALAEVIRFDSCQNLLTVADGFVSGITLSGVSPVNAVQLPQSIRASGRVPLNVTVYSTQSGNAVNSYTDNLSFDLGLNLIGPNNNFSGTTKNSITVGTSPSTTVYSQTAHDNESSGVASITSSTLSTNTLTPPPLSRAEIDIFKIRQITITRQ